MEVTKLAQRYAICALDENGVLPNDDKVAIAMAAALVFDLQVLHIIDVADNQISTKYNALDNIDDPERLVWEYIRDNGPVTLEDLAKLCSEGNAESYNKIMTAICSHPAQDGKLTAAGEQNGLVAYVPVEREVAKLIEHMVSSMTNVNNVALPGGFTGSTYDRALSILLDVSELLEVYLGGEELEKFKTQVAYEEHLDEVQAEALNQHYKGIAVKEDISDDLLGVMIVLGNLVEAAL